MVKSLPAMQKTWVWSLGWEDPQEKGTATHSSILAWRIPEEPGQLQSMGSQRVRHDWVTNTFTFASNACCPFCYLNSIYFSKFTSSPTFLMKHSLITLLFISSFPHHVLFHTTFTFFLPCMLVPSLHYIYIPWRWELYLLFLGTSPKCLVQVPKSSMR